MNKNLIKSALLATLMSLVVTSSVGAKTYENKIRLGGKDRFETAVQISKEFVKIGNKVTTVLIASSNAYADAVGSAPLAVYRNAPLLLTGVDKLNPTTKARLREMKDVTNIIVLGGEGVISANVVTELKGMGYTVQRLGGKDRYETNKKILAEIPKEVWGSRPKVTNGLDWQQNLSLAVDTRVTNPKNNETRNEFYVNPIIMVNPNEISKAEDLQWIASMLEETKNTWEKRYQGLYRANLDGKTMDNIRKISGRDNYKKLDSIFTRYDGIAYSEDSNPHRANIIINSSYKNVITNLTQDDLPYKRQAVALVNGEIFPDALALAPLAGRSGIPIVFANRDLQDVYGRAVTVEDIKYDFKMVYENAKEIIYVGGEAVMPNGREVYIEGRDK